jgi:hypothetical protein
MMHDIVVRTRGAEPELPSSILVDGHLVAIPADSKVRIEMGHQDVTTVTITMFAASFRVEPEPKEG